MSPLGALKCTQTSRGFGVWDSCKQRQAEHSLGMLPRWQLSTCAGGNRPVTSFCWHTASLGMLCLLVRGNAGEQMAAGPC